MEAGRAVAEGIHRADAGAEVLVRPLADGGEGTVEALTSGMNGSRQQVQVTGPLLIVWTLTGMWHGAAWNFIVWGFYYGVLLVMEKYVWGSEVDRLPSPLRRIYTAV